MDGAASADPPRVERLGVDFFRALLPSLDYGRLLRPRRRGEVAMIIQLRGPGWVLLQAKQHYPPGVFRLPTGTLKARETPEQAMLRELHEEANLVPGGHRRLGRLEYVIEGGRSDFFTDLFLIEAPAGELHPNDPEEAISAWREAPLFDLGRIASELRSLPSPWSGWGLFRSLIHDLVPLLLPELPLVGA